MADEMNEIVPGLFLGSCFAARDLDLLNSASITHILSIGGFQPLFPQHFKYFDIPVQDCAGVDISKHFDKCYEFIKQGLGENPTENHDSKENEGAVLVHCSAGVSRSTTIVCAYLMKSKEWTYEQTIKHVQSLRVEACPNEGFVRELMYYEAKLLSHRGLSKNIESLYPSDSTYDKSDKIVEYLCCKCRKPLFTSLNIIPHESTEHNTDLFVHKRHTSSQPCSSYFLDQMAWMGVWYGLQTDVEVTSADSQGKLLCPTPKCGHRLGSFSWHGGQCSCGAWVTPAFQVVKSKVDDRIAAKTKILM